MKELKEPEDIFLTEEFKSLDRWQKLYVRFKVALLTLSQLY